MMEHMGRIEEGLPVLDTHAYACLPSPRVAGVIYIHPLAIQLMSDDGEVTDSDALLTRARQLGWVSTSDFVGRAAPCPDWHATLDGDHLVVRQSDGGTWYEGTLPTNEAWRATARETGKVYHFTSARSDLDGFRQSMAAGQALTVVSRFS